MPNYAVNISMIFADRPLRERLRLVAEAGFRAFEFWFPYQFDMDELARFKDEFGLEVALFDLEPEPAYPQGHIAAADGERQFFERLDFAMRLAARLGCRRLNVLCGRRDPALTMEQQKEIVISRLRRAAPRAESEGIYLCPEGINRIDRPESFLSYSRDGFDIVDAVGSPNVLYQYDIYHMQLMEGNVTRTIQSNIARIGHIQIADPPNRREPGTGEINFPNVIRAIDATGYSGWISLEYNPTPGVDPFAWLRRSTEY